MSPRKPRRKYTPKSQDLHTETAALLRALRAEADLSQTEFAKALGASQSVVSKLEHGHLPPSLLAFQGAYRLARSITDRTGDAKHEHALLKFLAEGRV